MRTWIQRGKSDAALRFGMACLLLCIGATGNSQIGTVVDLPDAPSVASGAFVPRSETQASIRGTVMDSAGALVGGARIQVVDANGVALQETNSGNDGSFIVQQLPQGPATVCVTLQGFDPASVPITLSVDQALTMKPIVLRISTAKVEVDVTGPAQASSEDEVHVEETQRLFGFLPNFYVSYDWKSPALSAGEKYRLAAKDMRDPGNLLLVGTVAGVQQATNSFAGYGQGAAGYGKRYGADYANLEVGTLLGEAVLPAVMHQDPRYFYKGTGSVRSRVWYALSFAVVRRGDNGRRQFAYAGVLGDLSAGAVSNLYYPQSSRHGAELTFENGLLGIAGDALNGLFQEFFGRKVTPHAVAASTAGD